MKPTTLNTIIIAGLAVTGSLANAASFNAGVSAYERDLASWTIAQSSVTSNVAQENEFIARDLASWTVAQSNVTTDVAQGNAFYESDHASWTGNHASEITSVAQENTIYARDLAFWYGYGLRNS